MTIPDVLARLKTARNVAVACHFHPDGDALGSLLGMGALVRALGAECIQLTCDDPVPLRYAGLPGVEAIRTPAQAKPEGPFDTVIFVDISDLRRAGTATEELLAGGATLINVDHHISNDLYGDLNLVDSEAAATAEILVRLFAAADVEMDAATASQLYCGLLTDTGSFRHSNASPSSFATASRLVQAGANPAAIARMVYGSATERELRVMGSFLQRMETASEGRFALSWITPEETGLDTESFVETLTTLGGLEIGAFLRPADEGGWKLSLRSRGEADVAAIASKWGGGGHAKAAGANLEGSLDEVKKEVRQTCLEAIERLGREEP